MAKAGKVTFDQTCVTGSGMNALGAHMGPSLFRNIYNPGYHGDAAYFNTVRLGSPEHHWRIGNMLPQPHMTEPEIAAIVLYVRKSQEANGGVFRAHRM